MPVLCDTPVRCLSQDEFAQLDYSVMGHAFDCQNDLGRLAHEQIYQNDLKARLLRTGFAAECELKVRLIHEEYVKPLFIDLVVDQSGIYEFKTVTNLISRHEVQLLTYLYLLNLLHGKIINFRSPQLETRFVNAMIPRSDRIGFLVCANEYRGPTILLERTVALLRDWGTCLNLSLYQEALIHFLGGVDVVQRLLKLNRDGNELGRQRFQLVSDDEAFYLTALSADNDSYDKQVERLLSLSPLRAIHRINIAAHQVSLRTIA